MRICHLITRMIIGGAQENTLLTCLGLAERGHEVILVAGSETGPEGSLWPQVEAAGLRTVKVKELHRAVHPWHDWRCLARLRNLFVELNCDVVHTHSSKAGIIGRRAAARARVPLVVHTIHGMSFNRTQSGPIRSLYRTLERRAARHTHAFISVADAMTRQAVDAGLAPADRFTTVYSGMDTTRFGPNPETRARVRREWGIDDDQVVVGTIARLFRNKGYEQIIEAMPAMVQRNDKLRFVWVGDGKDRAAYLRRLHEMGLADRVVLTGLLPPERIPEVLTGFDILLHASKWEGLPRALPQALLTEVPVVSFDNDGAPEVVIPGQTGELVPFGDVDGLAAAVARLAGAPDERARLGRQGRERCLEMFDHRRMVEQIEELYCRVGEGI
ncbi:MAG: glycosyltransferase family 4 protein [bacterium]|nr:glycosyltransferase family 4 protein [bacterium]